MFFFGDLLIFFRVMYLFIILILLIIFTWDYFPKFYEFLLNVLRFIVDCLLPVVFFLVFLFEFVYFGIQLFFVM